MGIPVWFFEEESMIEDEDTIQARDSGRKDSPAMEKKETREKIPIETRGGLHVLSSAILEKGLD